jgi:hypothetical protein
MKRMKRAFLFVALSFLIISGISLALTAVTPGNPPGIMTKTEYAPGEAIYGDLNMSLANESGDSKVKFYDKTHSQQISLIDFLNAASEQILDINFSCIPADCSSVVSMVGASPIKYLTSNGTIGLKLAQGAVSSINILNFSISGSSSDVNCFGNYPFSIDVLGDDTLDYGYNVASTNFCHNDNPSNPSCFSDSGASDENITLAPVCEKTYIFRSNQIKLWAEVKNITSINGGSLKMSVYDLENENIVASCDLDIGSITGSYAFFNCIPPENITESKEYFICIRVAVGEDAGKFRVKKEQNSPYCGTIDYPGPGQTYSKAVGDFSLYTTEKGFNNLNGKTLFSANSSLLTDILGYVEENYGSICPAEGCLIPVKITAYQPVTLGDLVLNYSTPTITKVSPSFYNVTTVSSNITMNMSALPLNVANFTAPTALGSYTFNVSVGNTVLGKFSFNVTNTTAASRDQVWAEIAYKTQSLVAFIKQISDLKIKYPAYSASIDNYLSKLGMTVSVLNSTLISIDNESRQASPDWADLKSRLDALPIPDSVSSLPLQEMTIPVDVGRISPALLAQLGAGVPNSSAGTGYGLGTYKEKDIKESSGYWQEQNIIIKVSGEKVIALSQTSQPTGLFSVFSVRISSKDSLSGDTYFVVLFPSDVDLSIIGFAQDYSGYGRKTMANSVGFKFGSLTSTPNAIGFIVPGAHDYLDTSFFASPKFSLLPITQTTSCNDGICSAGETHDTCPEDCKPIVLIIWLIVFVAGALTAGYFALKYYYSHHYERSLFKNPSDLQNLLIFIRNAASRNLSDSETKEKLKQAGWKSEQIDYALAVFRGKKI